MADLGRCRLLTKDILREELLNSITYLLTDCDGKDALYEYYLAAVRYAISTIIFMKNLALFDPHDAIGVFEIT